MDIVPWENLSPSEQQHEFKNQYLAAQIRELLMEWARRYTHLAYDLVQEFGEEAVLDTLEETWWNLQYEGGLTFREEFDKDPEAALEAMYTSWHCGPNQGVTGIVMDAGFDAGSWDILSFRCYHPQVALELEGIEGRKIGISWCMSDLAAPRGWCTRAVMEFPNMQLRGDPFCRQIRTIKVEPNQTPTTWSRELSERYGWRSIKKLEG